MKKSICIVLGLFVYGLCCASYSAGSDVKKAETPAGKAKAIEATAGMMGKHQPIPEGVTCNDCHSVTFDANTTATQLWLTGDYASFAPGQGVMSTDRVRQEIIKAAGGKKQNRTMMLATCLNNIPLSTTAEFALDETRMTLHGIHEKGTQKLVHIQQNPRVSINWHHEFTGFSDTLCIQFIGQAKIIDGANPEFERIIRECTPTEERAKAMNMEPGKYIEMLKGRMVVSEITIEQAVITNAKFRNEGFRPWQRWKRQQ